jgi:hypothetical protein
MFFSKTISGIVFLMTSLAMSTTAFAAMDATGGTEMKEKDAITTPVEKMDQAPKHDLAAWKTGDKAFAPKIDVKPNDDLNKIDPKLDKTLEVALLGSAGFDVNNVDQDSLLLGNAKGDGRVRLADSNLDGFNDLIAEFSTEDLQLDEGSNELTLKGKTKDGKSFEGSDKITIGAIAE